MSMEETIWLAVLMSRIAPLKIRKNNNRIVLRFGVKRQRMCQVLNCEGVSPVARNDKRVIEIYMCMHYKYISSSWGKINVHWSRGLPKWCKIDKMLISKWEVVLGAPDRVNIPCLMHDIGFLQSVLLSLYLWGVLFKNFSDATLSSLGNSHNLQIKTVITETFVSINFVMTIHTIQIINKSLHMFWGANNPLMKILYLWISLWPLCSIKLILIFYRYMQA